MIHDRPQPNDAGRQNISFVFSAVATKKIGERDDESDDVQWFPLDALPAADTIAFDHAEIIEKFKQHLATPHATPFFA